MNEFNNLFDSKELIVRKKMVAFIEKTFRFLNYEFNHDDYKAMIYGEKECRTKQDFLLKSYYDSYFYLISNHQSALSSFILKRFFYLLNEEINEQLINKIVKLGYMFLNSKNLLDIIVFHYQVKKVLENEEISNYFIISLMLFNYGLLKHNIPTLRFTYNELIKYQKLEDNTTEKNEYLLSLILKGQYQDKNYYQNLKVLTKADVISELLKDKTELINHYKVKHLALFGSFLKNQERIDSDIDLLISFSLDISYIEKEKYINELKEKYLHKFNRFIDLLELPLILDDQFIFEISEVKHLF